MPGINREHKDRLFSFLFGSKSNREWTLSLYNAVNGTSYTDPEDIEFTTIENAVYMGMKNDVSFILFYVMNIYEQQSSYNPNMPVRQLMYAGKLYDKYIQVNGLNIYGKKQVRLPIPKLVTFYNGTEGAGDKVLKLSDAFQSDDGRMEPDIEVNLHAPGCGRTTNHESLAGAFGIPELMPPIRRRDFQSKGQDAQHQLREEHRTDGSMQTSGRVCVGGGADSAEPGVRNGDRRSGG